MIIGNDRQNLLTSTYPTRQSSHHDIGVSGKAGSHVRRKRRRKRRSYVERKRKQNEIRTHISEYQDGSNLVSRVRVTLDQQLGNEDSGLWERE